MSNFLIPGARSLYNIIHHLIMGGGGGGGGDGLGRPAGCFKGEQCARRAPLKSSGGGKSHSLFKF